MSSPEESSWSASKMRECRERQRRLQAQDAKTNDQRIMHDHIRFLCAVATSNFKIAEYLRYNDLSRLAQVPEEESPAWLGHAYHASPRALSVDATAWTDCDNSIYPRTTWKASWSEWGTNATPPLKPTKPTKTSFPRRMKERFAAKFQQKPPSQKPNTPHYVSAFRRALPSRQPRGPVRKTPTPQQGGFIEHLDENARYQDMLNSDSGRGVVHTKKSKDGRETEALTEAQKKAADSEVKTEIDVDQKAASRDGQGMEDNAATKEGRKRDTATTVISWFLCPGQLSRRPRNGLSMAQAKGGGSEEQLLSNKEV